MARIVLLVAFFTFFSAVYCAPYKCAGVATYKLSFYGKWSNMTHPFAFPEGGFFSPLVGCSHGEIYIMWESGMMASPGVKAVAEMGNSSTMKTEIWAAINTNKTAWKLISTSGPINNNADVMNIEVEVTQDFPYVSLITMLAPSPDWFTGIMKKSLCDSTTGKWKDSFNITMLSPWDAGTDNGTTFNTTNIKTDPAVGIEIITNRPPPDTNFKNISGPIPTLGQLMFQRTNPPTMTKCSGEQKYMVKVEALWSKETHPSEFPTTKPAKFSPLVIATHTYRYKFWSDMTRASPGVKLVAETGDPETLYGEIKPMIKNFVFKADKGDDTFNSPDGSATMMITVKDGYTLMSFISMIVPSPDWFVGLDSYDLCGDNGQWKDNIDMDLRPWDAGTDSGTDFESADDPTMPVEFIKRIFQSSKPFAKITIKKYTKPTPDSAHGLSAGVFTFLPIAFLAILRLLY